MKDNRKIFILVESVLALMLIGLAARMFWERNGESRYQVAVIIQNSDSSQWASFNTALRWRRRIGIWSCPLSAQELF